MTETVLLTEAVRIAPLENFQTQLIPLIAICGQHAFLANTSIQTGQERLTEFVQIVLAESLQRSTTSINAETLRNVLPVNISLPIKLWIVTKFAATARGVNLVPGTMKLYAKFTQIAARGASSKLMLAKEMIAHAQGVSTVNTHKALTKRAA